MTTEQLALHNKAFELALKYGFTLDDEVNFLWHDDPELGQELSYDGTFDDVAFDDVAFDDVAFEDPLLTTLFLTID